MTNLYVISLPEVDEWGTPRTKMPNCPHCGDDELGMMATDRAVCHRCSAVIVRHMPDQPITESLVVCNNCSWMGTVLACEPDYSGELHCPQCLDWIRVQIESGNPRP